MSGVLFNPPRFTPVNSSGRPYPGAKLHVYRAGTTTQAVPYTTAALSTQHTNPIIANSAGQFGAIYLDPTTGHDYKFVLTTSGGTQLWSEDNVPANSLTATTVGAVLYPRTSAEISTSVTPSAYQYPPGDVRRYGASPTATDNSAAFLRAVTQAGNSAGSDVYATGGTYSFTAHVTLPNANVRIHGDATLHSDDAITNGILYQTNRGVLTEIEGLTCTGASPLFKRVALDTPLPWTDHYLEYRIVRVNFMQDADTYGAHIYGAREGTFALCHFETCKGVYSDYSINMEFISCTGKNAVQFVDARSGSEGIKFIGGTALGMTYCVKATGVLGIQVGNVMWDYCDNPIHLTGCQQIGIIGSYITSRSVNPVINVLPDGATHSEDVYIVGNLQLANVADPATTDVEVAGNGYIIKMEDTDYVTIAENEIKLWRDIGVYLDTCTQVLVHGNKIIAHPDGANYSVKTVTSDTSVVIESNTVTDPIDTVATRSVRHNTGYVTENSGETTFTAGATSRTVAHGLAKAPLKGDVKITPTSTLGTATEIWVSAVDATNITLTTDVDPVTNVTVSWSARVSVG
jgi:hypothetical protein